MKYIKVLIICMFLCVLVGCDKESSTNQQKQQSEQKESNGNNNIEVLDNIPATLQREQGNVTFDATVNMNGYDKEKGLVTATATLQRLDEEKAFDTFWKSGEYEDYGYEGKNEYGETVEVISVEDKGHMVTYDSGPNSSQFSYAEGYLLPYLLGAFNLEKGYEDYNADKYSLTEQLDFMTREEAYNNLMNVLNGIGLDFEAKYNAYALDAKTLEEEEYHMDMDGGIEEESYKDSWTKKDESYYFSMRQTYQGIPVFYASYGGASKEYDNDAYTAVQAIVSEAGIEQINADMIFQFSSEETVKKVADFEMVTETLANKFNNILGDEKYTFSQIELVYVIDVSKGVGVYEMKPAWVFLGTQSDGSRIQVLIDAQTGKEVIL